MNAILLFLSFLFLAVSSVSASDAMTHPGDTLFRVPVVRYFPGHFGDELECSFRNSLTYIEVEKVKNDTTYTLVSYDKRSDSYGTDFLERNNMALSLFWGGDSVAFVDFETVFDDLGCNYPIYRSFAVKRNGFFMFGDPAAPDIVMPLQIFVNKHYGSTAKFKEMILERTERYMSLYTDTMNGCCDLYENGFTKNGNLNNHIWDVDSMLAWIKSDYAFYEIRNPEDTLGAVDRYMDLLESFVVLEGRQRELFYEGALSDIRGCYIGVKNFNLPVKNDDMAEHFVVMHTDMMEHLNYYLTEEQSAILKRKLKEYNYTRRLFVERLVMKNYAGMSYDDLNERGLEYCLGAFAKKLNE